MVDALLRFISIIVIAITAGAAYCATPPVQSFDEMMKLGEMLDAESQYTGAIESFTAAIKAYPNQARLFYRRGLGIQ